MAERERWRKKDGGLQRVKGRERERERDRKKNCDR